jgi:hypothetical protein
MQGSNRSFIFTLLLIFITSVGVAQDDGSSSGAQPKFAPIANAGDGGPRVAIEVGPVAPVTPSEKATAIGEWQPRDKKGNEIDGLLFDIVMNRRVIDPNDTALATKLRTKYNKLKHGVVVDDFYLEGNSIKYAGADMGASFGTNVGGVAKEIVDDPDEANDLYDELLKQWKSQVRRVLLQPRVENLVSHNETPVYIGLASLNGAPTDEQTERNYLAALHPIFSGSDIDAGFTDENDDGFLKFGNALPAFKFYYLNNGKAVEWASRDQNILTMKMRRLVRSLKAIREAKAAREANLNAADAKIEKAKAAITSKVENDINAAMTLLTEAKGEWEKNASGDRLKGAQARIDVATQALQNALVELPYPKEIALTEGCQSAQLRQDSSKVIVVYEPTSKNVLAKFSAPLSSFACAKESLIVIGNLMGAVPGQPATTLPLALNKATTNVEGTTLAEKGLANGLFLFQGNRLVTARSASEEGAYTELKPETDLPWPVAFSISLNGKADRRLELSGDGSTLRTRLKVPAEFNAFRFIQGEGTNVNLVKVTKEGEKTIATLNGINIDKMSAQGESIALIAENLVTEIPVEIAKGPADAGGPKLYVFTPTGKFVRYNTADAQGFGSVGIAAVHDGQNGFRAIPQAGTTYLDVMPDQSFVENRLRFGMNCAAHYLSALGEKSLRISVKGAPDKMVLEADDLTQMACVGNSIAIIASTYRFDRDAVKAAAVPNPGAISVDEALKGGVGPILVIAQGEKLVAIQRPLAGLNWGALEQPKNPSTEPSFKIAFNGFATFAADIGQDGVWNRPQWRAPNAPESYGLLHIDESKTDLVVRGGTVIGMLTGTTSTIARDKSIAFIASNFIGNANAMTNAVKATELTVEMKDPLKVSGSNLLIILEENTLVQVAEPDPKEHKNQFTTVKSLTSPRGEVGFQAAVANTPLTVFFPGDGSAFEFLAARGKSPKPAAEAAPAEEVK